MALVISGIHSSGPGLDFQLYADQTGGSGNSRTIKLTLNLKVAGSSSASWFGYAMDHRFNVNGSWSGWTQTKGTESWNATQGYRTWTYTVTTDVGTSSEKDITVGFQTDAHHSSNSWDTTRTGTFRVGKTNTAPYFTSGEQWLRLRPSSDSGTAFNGYYPENVSYLYIDWGYASDSEGGTINYSLNQSINGGGWSRVDYGTDRAHGIQIGSGNEGQKMQFYVDAVDNGGLWSNKVYSATITKNTLSGGSVSSVTSINYDSSSFEVTVGAGRNSDGSTVNYRIYSDNITIHNQTDSTGLKHTVQIYKSGNVPTTPYIRFDDIKNYLKNSSYNGRIHIGVKTTNNYGSVKWSGGSVGIDLRTNPNPASSQQISTSSSESTMYIKPAFSPNYYFLPDGSKVARVKWNVGSDKLGDAITQELYVAYGSGSWQKIADLNGSTSYYNHAISKQTSRQQFKYLIRTKTSYGYYTDAQTPAENLEYYNSPKITVGTISRTAWTAEVKITVKSDSSIPNIGTTGWWECRNTVETTVLVENPNGTLNETQNEQIIYIDPLFGENEHSLLVNYNDNTGFSTDKRQEINIPANKPTFFVNKYGAGVGGAKADIDTALNVTGLAKASGFNATGFGSVSLGDIVNKWIKLVTLKINRQYGDASTTFNMLDWGSGSGNPITGKVTVRVKQQNPMGQPAIYSCILSDNVYVVNTDIRLIITQNTIGITEAQVWMYVRQKYTGISVAPVQSLGTVEYRDGSPYFDAPPDGPYISASYIDVNASTVNTTSSGNCNNVKLGDDVYIGDVNIPNCFCVKGIQNSGAGYITFGNGGGKIGFNGNGGSSIDILPGTTNGALNRVYVASSLYIDGNLHPGNNAGLSWRYNGDGADITFNSADGNTNSYLRYQVTDDLNEYHQFGGVHYSNGFQEWARINSGGIDAKSLNTGNIRLTGRDVIINGKRALVGMSTNDGNILYVNYGKDYASGVRMEGDLGVTGPIKTNMWVECGKYDQNRTNDGESRFVAGASDTRGSSKIQIGSSTSATFEIVNHTWSDAWFSCSSSGIKSKSYANFSDADLKTNIREATKVTDKIKNINLYNYNYKSDIVTNSKTKNIAIDENCPDTRWGVIAQEVEMIFPELIIESDVLTGGEVTKVKSVDVYGLVCVTLEYAKEIKAELDYLKEELGINNTQKVIQEDLL